MQCFPQESSDSVSYCHNTIHWNWPFVSHLWFCNGLCGYWNDRLQCHPYNDPKVINERIMHNSWARGLWPYLPLEVKSSTFQIGNTQTMNVFRLLGNMKTYLQPMDKQMEAQQKTGGKKTTQNNGKLPMMGTSAMNTRRMEFATLQQEGATEKGVMLLWNIHIKCFQLCFCSTSVRWGKLLS